MSVLARIRDSGGAASITDLATVTVLIPMYNERHVLPLLYAGLHPVLDALDATTQILFIDDGSSDGSAEWVEALRRDDPRVGLLRLSRNFGKEAALTAGLDHADSETVIVLDADLQDPPGLIPEMLQRWREGYDVVLMRRRRREGESRLKIWTSLLFYRLLDRLSDTAIPRDVGDFRLLSRRAVLAMRRLPERTRYMKGLFAWVGLPQCEILFDRPARAAGTTKWPWRKLVRLASDGLFAFSTAPLRLAAVAGAISAVLALIAGAVLLAMALGGHRDLSHPVMLVAMLFIGGIQLVGLGILGEYVGRIYTETKQRPLYLTQAFLPPRPLRGRAALHRAAP